MEKKTEKSKLKDQTSCPPIIKNTPSKKTTSEISTLTKDSYLTPKKTSFLDMRKHLYKTLKGINHKGKDTVMMHN